MYLFVVMCSWDSQTPSLIPMLSNLFNVKYYATLKICATGNEANEPHTFILFQRDRDYST